MSDSSHPLLIACDGGGTGCRVAVGTARDGILATAEGGAANANTDAENTRRNILDATRTALRQAGFAPEDLTRATAHLGLAGILAATEGARFDDSLPFARSTVTDDRLTTLTGALGPGDGFVAAVGTGSFLAARQNGTARFLGGWGFPVGDQASGAWLARRALEVTLECHDGTRPHSDMTRALMARFEGNARALCRFSFTASPRDYGSLAPLVFDAARARDPHGLPIVEAGAAYLVAALAALDYRSPQPLVLTGGAGPAYAEFLPAPLRAALTPRRGSALDGAFELARAAAETPVPAP